MPKVQITLEVADAGAVQKIQQFSRSVQDAFSQVKAGDPALQSATARVRELTTAKATATATVTGFGTSFVRMAGSVAAGIGVYQGLTAALGVLRGGLLDTNATLERSTLQFTTLLGSADAAKTHVQDLFKFAAETPFETGPIIDASRQLLTFGVAAQDVTGTLKLVGDAAAVSNQGIQDVAFWFGRAYSAIQAGRPFGEAAMRLQEMGILTAKGRNELEALQKSGASADVIFKRLTDEFGRFDGSMGKLAGTWEGLTSTIKDNVNLVLSQALRPFFEVLKELTAETAKFVQSADFADWAKRTEASFRSAIGVLREWGEAFGLVGRSAETDLDRVNRQIEHSRKMMQSMEGDDLGSRVNRFFGLWAKHLGDLNAALAERDRLLLEIQRKGERAMIASAGGRPRPPGGSALAGLPDPEEMEKFARSTERATQEAARFAEQMERWEEAATEKFVRVLHGETEDLWKEVQTATDRFDGFGLALDAHVQTLREWNDEINASVGVYQDSGEAIGRFRTVIDGVRDGLGQVNPQYRLFAEGAAEADRAHQILERDVAAIVPVLEAYAEQMKAGATATAAVMTPAVTELDRAMAAFGRETLRDLSRALSDLFLSATEGFRNLEDVGRRALDGLLRAVADFLASAAVGALRDFLSGAASGFTGTPVEGSAGSSASGAAGNAAGAAAGAIVDAIIEFFVNQAPRIGQAISEGIVAASEQTKELIIAAHKSGAEVAVDILGGAGKGAITGAVSGGVSGGPVGAVVGAIGGAILGAVREAFGAVVHAVTGFVKDVFSGPSAAAMGAANAALNDAAKALEGAMGAMGDMTASSASALNDAAKALEGAMGPVSDMGAAATDMATSAGIMGDAYDAAAAAVMDAGAAVGEAASAAADFANDAARAAAAARMHDQGSFDPTAPFDQGGPGTGGGGSGTGPGGSDIGGTDPGGHGDSGSQRQVGGWVPGGRWGRDHVPAVLDGGEFVVAAGMARRHARTLEAINAGGGDRREGLGPEERALWREEIEAIRELTREMRRRRAAGVGAAL
jgi:hypothetical protein